MLIQRLLFIIPLLIVILTYTDPSACTGSAQFYDPVLLQCTTCPSNTIRATDLSFCNCSTSSYPNLDVIGFNNPSSCLALSSTYNPSNQIASIYASDGSLSPQVVTCFNGYPNTNNLRCVPCGSGMTYSSVTGCECTNGNEYAINGQCYASTASWTVTQTTTVDKLGEIQVPFPSFRHKWAASNTD